MLRGGYHQWQVGFNVPTTLPASGLALEELDRALVLLGRRSRGERAEIAPPPGSRIDFPRVQPVLTGLELPNHSRLRSHEAVLYAVVLRLRGAVFRVCLVRAARRAAACRPAGPFVRTALRAAAFRAAAGRRRAALLACRESAFVEAAARPSLFSAFLTARERRGDALRPLRAARLADFALRFVPGEAEAGGGGSFTPARRAFESPMAMACFADRAPCLPSRM